MSVSEGGDAAERGERVGVIVIHGVGEVEPGWVNERLVRRFDERADSPAFSPHSEVYKLSDASPRSDRRREFPVYVRRGQSKGGRKVSLIELYWADLSQIGTSALANWLATLQLFYEAPQVLGDGFLDGTRNLIASAIDWLVGLANWILRWPITGLNTAALVCAIALLIRQPLVDRGKQFAGPPFEFLLMIELPLVMAGLLGILAVCALAFARWRVHRDIALTDIGMSTMVFSTLMMAVILMAYYFVGPEALSNPAIYLMGAGITIFGFWYIWNYAVFLAILLMVPLIVQQVLPFKSIARVALARAAAAVGLSLTQGVIYKVVIALLWIFIFVTLDFNERTEAACASDPFGACQYLLTVRYDLTGIVVFNLLMVGVLCIAFALVALFRSLMRWPASRVTKPESVPMPRVIVSPLVIAILMAGTVFNLVIFYWRENIPVDLYQQVDVRLLPVAQVIGVLIGGGTAISLAFYVFRALQHASRGVLHIVRDIVDHQYAPRFTLSRYLLPGAGHTDFAHPRRERIERRLDTLLKELVAKERYDRLVFVAHSQGTVILHDYLRSGRGDAAIASAKAIDVLTLGSPLSHIYQYYFARFEQESTGPGAINPRITSWTNLWRVDDPIGHRVTLNASPFIRNVSLRPGGHVDYWKDPVVQSAILDLIDPERAQNDADRALVSSPG